MVTFCIDFRTWFAVDLLTEKVAPLFFDLSY